MNKSNKRGKIPQSDWPLIIARYDAGETLASIARTYDCSPPAISYVVSRGRTAQPGATPPPPTSASAPAAIQLVKANAPDAPANGHAKTASGNGMTGTGEFRVPAPENGQPMAAAAPSSTQAEHSENRDPSWSRRPNGSAGNGSAERNASATGLAGQAARASELPRQPNGDQRRRLHLSLGNSPSIEGAAAAPEPHAPVEPSPVTAGNGATAFGADGQANDGFREPSPAPVYNESGRRDAGDAARRDGASFIDKELRARVDGDIAAFLAAFDVALIRDTQESRTALRDATDRLLRAGARTRIELERLEARMPLPPRGNGGPPEPIWRSR